MRRSALAGIAIVIAAAAMAHAGEGPSLGWWTTHALDKVRPTDLPRVQAGPSRSPSLAAARNEFESFQVVLRGGAQATRDVDVLPVEMRRTTPDGATGAFPVATVYKVGYVRIQKPSSIEGGTGPWPDPLFPRTDAYSGERRNAFPFEVPAGLNQPLWIELYVPPGTAPGSYAGEVRVVAGGEAQIRVPFTLEVWPFLLPSTSTLRSSYGFSGIAALNQHRGRYTDDAELTAITMLYARAALRHRLSLHAATMIPPPVDAATGEVRWDAYDAEMAPLLDGTIHGEGEPLPGARATSADLRLPALPAGPTQQRYLAAWARHFRERGWLDRLFLYMKDEPTPEDYPAVLALGRDVRRADPDILMLLTEPFVTSLAEVVGIWTPPVNTIGARPDEPETCGQTVARESYRQAESRGAHLWWYQSCCSHGCDEIGGEPFTGWPSYVIDAPAMAHRIMPWLAWTFDIEGELYYNTVEAYGPGANPFADFRLHGGNGDGTLFYPGTPDRVGGKTDLPIESLRLKLIRDGYEDHEYLTLLAGLGRRPAASRYARAIAPEPRRWEPEPEDLERTRRALARDIIAAGEARPALLAGSATGASQ